MLKLHLTDQAKSQLESLKADPASKAIHKQVSKVLKFTMADLRHPSLKTHKFDGYPSPFDDNKPVFEAYAQNKVPGAYRIFWCYGPNSGEITILAITPHP